MTKIQFIFLTAFFCFFVGMAGKLSAQVTVAGSNGANSTYTTLELAFDAINANVNQSGKNIVITITASITDNATANLTGYSTNSWSSLTIYPTTSLTISGDVAGPLIVLNGADNVTIDGRVDLTGSSVDMTLQNKSISTTPETSTISFLNDAEDNTLCYCYVLGSSKASIGGIIYFGSGSISGNSNNTVGYCNISNSLENRPLNALYSISSGVNLGNQIEYNNFYDFFNPGADSYGINLSSGTSNWSIYYNSFYETTSFAPGSSWTYYCINVNNTSGTQFNISNNYIGGTAAICGGTALTKSTGNNVFYGIRISAGTAFISNVNGNTLKNITWANSGNAAFYGIAGSDGYLNIGTAGGGNVIGASSGNGSITYSAGATGGIFYGICCMTAGSFSVDGNTIGAVTADNSVNLGTNLYGIYCGGANTVPGNTISGNTLSNLINDADGSTSLINGIYVGSGKNSVTGNTVHDLSIPYSNNTSSNHMLSAGGIVIYNSTAVAQTISGNTVYNVSNSSYSFTGSLAGIYYSGPITASSVSGNFIYGITATGGGSSGSVYGIKADAGTTTFANNIINLSSNVRSFLYGIYEPGTSGNNSYAYFNTIYFTGTSCLQNSYCLYSAGSTNTRNFWNNILNNYRSTLVTAKAYCIYYAATGGTLTTDYNDYDATGTGGTLGYYGGDKIVLPIVPNPQDEHSLANNPTFDDLVTTTATTYYPYYPLVGVSIIDITTDYSGTTRAATPSMGAIEAALLFSWAGTTSTDWSGAGNWSSGKVPHSTTNVSIPASPSRQPSVTTSTSNYSYCGNMTIESGATLTIGPGKALKVNGTLTNTVNGGLVLQSSPTETGQLIHFTSSVSATMQRYIAGWTAGTNNGWHFLSSPVSSQAIATAFTDPTPANYDFYGWRESDNLWLNYKAGDFSGWNGGTNFVPGRGYLVAYSSDGLRHFTGSLNVANVEVTGLTNTGTATYAGFNLIGNPFPCALTWNGQSLYWQLSNIDNNCQIWNEHDASYSVIVPGGIIPPTNGFMVHVSPIGTGSLTLPNMERCFNATPWYKSEETEENRIVLKAIDAAGQTAQETIIAFNPGATEEFDPLFDSYFLAGYAPMFYSVSRNKDYALKCLPELNSSLIVPLSFIKNNSNEFGIELITNIPGTNVYLTDLKLNKTQNLANDPVYLFSSAAGDAAERFQLSFVLNGTGEEKKLISDIYAWENSVYVRNQGTSELQVYNLTGQTVFSERISQQGLCRSVLNVPSGYYIARLTGDAGVSVKKIHINN